MVYNLIRLPAVTDQIAFQSGPDKLVNGLLDPAPVPAIIFQHPLVDGQAAIHLKVEDSLRLFVGEETVLHEPGDEIFFGKLAETFQQSGGGGLIGEKDAKFPAFLHLPAEWIGAAALFRAHHMVKHLGGVPDHFFYHIVQHILQIVIVQIKGSPIDLRKTADLRDRDLCERLLLHQRQQGLANDGSGIAGAPVCPRILFSVFQIKNSLNF